MKWLAWLFAFVAFPFVLVSRWRSGRHAPPLVLFASGMQTKGYAARVSYRGDTFVSDVGSSFWYNERTGERYNDRDYFGIGPKLSNACFAHMVSRSVDNHVRAHHAKDES